MKAVVVHLDRLLAERGMTMTELARRIDVTPVNVSILKTGKARAVRFSTLIAICEVLNCQPGDILTVEEREEPRRGDVSLAADQQD